MPKKNKRSRTKMTPSQHKSQPRSSSSAKVGTDQTTQNMDTPGLSNTVALPPTEGSSDGSAAPAKSSTDTPSQLKTYTQSSSNANADASKLRKPISRKTEKEHGSSNANIAMSKLSEIPRTEKNYTQISPNASEDTDGSSHSDLARSMFPTPSNASGGSSGDRSHEDVAMGRDGELLAIGGDQPSYSSILDVWPNEVLQEITENIFEFSDLKSMMLTCKRFKDVVYPAVYQRIYISTTRTDRWTTIERTHATKLVKIIQQDSKRWLLVDGLKRFKRMLDLLCHTSSHQIMWKPLVKRVVFDHIFYETPLVLQLRGTSWHPVDVLEGLITSGGMRAGVLEPHQGGLPAISPELTLSFRKPETDQMIELPDAWKEIIGEIHTNTRLTRGSPDNPLPSYTISIDELHQSRILATAYSSAESHEQERDHMSSKREMITERGNFYERIARGLAHLCTQDPSPKELGLKVCQLNFLNYSNTNSGNATQEQFTAHVHCISNTPMNGSQPDRDMSLAFDTLMERTIHGPHTRGLNQM